MKKNGSATEKISINEDFNLFKVLSSRENIDNPYPVYHQLREYDPVFKPPLRSIVDL